MQHPLNTSGWFYPNQLTAATNVWVSSGTNYYPPVIHSGQPTDWERAAVKAEPDDEFSWLRKRVREVEEMAFA